MGDSARPEARARLLLAIGFARDPVGQPRNTARMLRRRPAREARDGKIEAAPPEVDRARLAREARAEALEHRHHRREGGAQSISGIAVVIARRLVLGERNGVRNLVRHSVEVRRQAVPLEQRDQS